MGFYTVDAARMLMRSEPAPAVAWWDFDAELGVDVSLAGILEFPDRRWATIGQGSSRPFGRRAFVTVPGTTDGAAPDEAREMLSLEGARSVGP